jgi:hypothetical protein
MLMASALPTWSSDLITVLDGNTVEVRSEPRSPRLGEPVAYVVGIKDRRAQPMLSASVRLTGSIGGAETIDVPLESTDRPGTYRGVVSFSAAGRWDMRLTIVVPHLPRAELTFDEGVER